MTKTCRDKLKKKEKLSEELKVFIVEKGEALQKVQIQKAGVWFFLIQCFACEIEVTGMRSR